MAICWQRAICITDIEHRTKYITGLKYFHEKEKWEKSNNGAKTSQRHQVTNVPTAGEQGN